MTIGLTNRADAIGNDVAVAFDYDFKIFAATHLDVRVRDADGVETTLTYPTQYTVSGVGSADGGQVTLVDVDGAWQNASDGSLKTGYSIAIKRVVPVLQSTDVRNQGSFRASVHEDAFDYLTMIDQQQEDAIARAMRLPPSYDPDAFDMELPAPIAGAAIGWNDDEDGLVNLVDLGGVGVSAFMATVLDDADAAAARATLGAAKSGANTDITSLASPAIAAATATTQAAGTNNTAVATTAHVYAALRAYVVPAIRSYLAGCTLSTAGSSATMSVAAGVAVDSANVSAMAVAAIAKTTSAWAVGTGNGGLDTGAIANSTWYHFFAIQRVDTGVVDVLISLSATSPTMPANYTLSRRIGSGLTNGSAQWVAFTQDGDLFQWSVPVLETTGADAGTSAITQTLANVPTGVNVIAMMNLVDGGAGNAAFYISDLATTDAAPSTSAAPGLVLGLNNTGVQAQCRTNTSAQIRTRGSASGGGQKLNITTLGWRDRRGRDS